MAAFQKRLETAMRTGNLRVADLVRWFGRPDPTVRQWVHYGVQPTGGPKDVEDIEQRLALLERAIKAGKQLPLPPRLSPGDRIKRLNDAALSA